MERYTVEDAARLISRFSPDNPLIVPPAMYARLEEMPRLADLMQNVRPNLPIPLTHWMPLPPPPGRLQEEG